MPNVAVRHIIKEGAVSLNRPLTGAVTGNAYTVDQVGRASIDITDLSALLAGGNRAVDRPVRRRVLSGQRRTNTERDPRIALRPHRRQLQQHSPVFKPAAPEFRAPPGSPSAQHLKETDDERSR